MLRRLPALFPLLIAALLALATWWLEYTVSRQQSGAAAPARNDPDAIVENFRISRYNSQGELSMSLAGPRLTHFPLDDSAEILQPEVRFLGQGGARQSQWNAEHARISQQGQEVRLSGNVRGLRPATPGSTEMRFATETLTLLPREELAHTSAPLAVTQGRVHLKGNGGEWNNLTGQLKVWQADVTFQRENTP